MQISSGPTVSERDTFVAAHFSWNDRFQLIAHSK